jgi:hypothetical protein
MNTTFVPSCMSTQYPANPGRTISSDTTMIRDAHWYALAAGERSSVGVVTGHAHNTCVRGEGKATAFSRNRWKDIDLRGLPARSRVSSSATRKRQIGNLSHGQSECQRAKRHRFVLFFTKSLQPQMMKRKPCCGTARRVLD